MNAPGTRRLWQLLIVATIVPLAATILLYRRDVPLGCPGRLAYPYSPVVGMRLTNALPAIGLAVLLALGVWWMTRARARRWALALVLACVTALGVWSYLAPPYHHNQHLFNAHSPSHDGAFVVEAVQIESLGAYLADFAERARTPPERMRGTRVISNPPGATVIAWTARQLVERVPGLLDMAAGPMPADLPDTQAFRLIRRSGAVGIVFFWLLTALWLLAWPVWYAVGRVYFEPVVAATFAVGCVLTPMTLVFTPGKDAAQLLTTGVPLLLWLVAVQRGSAWYAAAAGLLFTAACLASLVHVWIALVVLVATLAAGWRDGGTSVRQMLLRSLLPAVVGAIVGIVALRWLVGYDFIGASRAVAAAQVAVTRGADAMPLQWQALGVLLFLLLAGPLWWTVTSWCAAPGTEFGRAADREARFGRWLLVTTVIVMLATVGYTNIETPRLWIPFAPLLLLGTFLQLQALRGTPRHLGMILAALVFAHITAAALQWSVLDMREAENRLAEQRFFGEARATGN